MLMGYRTRRWAELLRSLPWSTPESNFCANATYGRRLDDPAAFNWCSVPGGAPDAFLFAALAVLVACCLHFSSLSAVFVLVAGALAEGVVFPFNLGRLGNAFTLWLGIDPPDLFFYAFLPPLLLDCALSIDYFLFHKVMLQVMTFAFLVVVLSAFLATPLLLYVLGLASHGWRWQHGALFSAMLASTDALAITAVLRQAGGPESLVTLMEGESLLNDASGIVLFELFHSLVWQLSGQGTGKAPTSPLSVLPMMTSDIAQLAAGGVLVGLTAGVLMRRLLRTLRWYGASASQEVAAIQAMGYIVFYMANSPLKVSGVIAVVVFGLYGNSCSCFELESSRHMREADAVRKTVSFALNGIVFFFAGASAVNFMIRAVESLRDYTHSFALFPPIYLSMFLIRGFCILLFNPLFRLLGSRALSLKAVLFATWGGLRGAISLIMAQAIITDEALTTESQLVIAQMGLWTSLFVLSTLLINAPTIPAVLRFTGLSEVSPVKLSIREKAKRALLRYTAAAIQDLKADEDEMLRGVNWGAVARYVDLSDELQQFTPASDGQNGSGGGAEADGGREAAHQQQEPRTAHWLTTQVPAVNEEVPAPALSDSRYGLAERQSTAVEALTGKEELFDAAGWAAPSGPRSSVHSRRAAALADLGRVSAKTPLNSSRRLLGASLAKVSHKWEPRSTAVPLPGMASSDEGSGSDIEAPLLPPSPRPGPGAGPDSGAAAGRQGPAAHRGRDVSAAGSSQPPGAEDSVGRLKKYGSREFLDESPFFPAAQAGGSKTEEAPHLASAKSAPQMHTIVEVGGSEEEFSVSSEDDAAVAPAAGSTLQQQQALQLEDNSSRGLGRRPTVDQPLQPQQPSHGHQHFARLDFEILPSFPSDAAMNMHDSGSATPAGSGMPAAAQGGGSSGSGNGSYESLPGAAMGPDLTTTTGGAAAMPPTAAALRVAVLRLSQPTSPHPLALRLARTSAPTSMTGASSAPMSPRIAAGRPGVAAALPAEAASLPQSPRTMHGLVRTSLLPAAADRQAVQHVGELLSTDDDLSMPPMSPRSFGASPGAGTQASPRLQQQAAATQAAADMPGPSSQPIRTSRAVPAIPHYRRIDTGGSSSSGMAGSATTAGPHGFGGLLQARTSFGLSSVLRPISPLLGSAAGSSEPADEPEEQERQQQAGDSPPPPAPQQQQQQQQHVGCEASGEIEQPPLPLLNADEAALGGEEAGMQVPGEAGTAAFQGEVNTGLELQAEAGQPAEVTLPPVFADLHIRLPERAATIAGPKLAETYSLAEPRRLPFVLEGYQAGHRHSASATPMAGAGMAVTSAFSASPLVKPWLAGAQLLCRSMSTPLMGAAEEGQAADGGRQGAAAPDRAASVGEPGVPSTPSSAAAGGLWSAEVLAEARMRLVAGLKRYFHAKRGEGLLSAQGLRILDYACDRAIDQASEPLDIWSVAEGEAVGKYMVRVLAWLFFRSKRLTGQLPRWLRFLLMPPLRWFSGLIGSILSVTMLVACEVAVEYWMALTWSPQAQWLRESEKAGQLQAEIAEESSHVCKFIINREIEAPERFQAIQSYRAAMAILRQQAAFVDELYASGIVNDPEREVMQEPIQRKGRQLEIRGPIWQAPSVREVLRGLPFLHHVPQPMFDWILERGQLLEYTRGEVIWAPTAEQQAAVSGSTTSGRARDLGLFIVVYGLVRSSFTDLRGTSHEYFLGSGGVLGLLSALVGQPLRGSGPAVAEANALHKGPVIFHIPQAVVRRVRQRAAAGHHDFAQLELDLFRVAGLYIVERLKGEVWAAVAAQYQRLAVDRARRRAIHKAAVKAEAARAHANEEHGAQRAAAVLAGPQGREQHGDAAQTAEQAAGLRQRVHWHSSLGDEQEALPSLLQSPSSAALLPRPTSFVPLTDAEVLRRMDRHRLWHEAQAFARGILADLRHHLRDAELLSLVPKQPWRQRSHALLVHGALHGSAGGGGMSFAGCSGHDVTAPAVMPWLLGHLQGATTAVQAIMLPASLQAAAVTTSGTRFTAGSAGALLLVCPHEQGSPLTPGSSVGSASDFDGPISPADGAWKEGWRPEQEEGGQAVPRSAEDQADELRGSADVEAAAGQQQQQQQRLEPTGRPLQRVKSRRLPMSAALSGMEQVV